MFEVLAMQQLQTVCLERRDCRRSVTDTLRSVSLTVRFEWRDVVYIDFKRMTRTDELLFCLSVCLSVYLSSPVNE